MRNNLLSEIPESVVRLGETTFIKVPLYKAKDSYQPIYINQALFVEYISKNKHFNWINAASMLSNLFSNTLNKENATGLQVGWAYCDKQFDPSDLSLSGNSGSGRAYYVGKRFNIKGEKTPLAVAKKKQYNDGILSMEDGLWETIVANALQNSFHLNIFSVLAVLKLNQTCTRPYQGSEVVLPQVQIIRIDQNRSLDRISHAFYQKKPFKKEQLKEIAQHFGVLEADKFIDRIEHGMWSAGNVSPQGHLIDLQTVCGVKGRHPQYSATKYHAENYFGFEYAGQLKILQSLVDFLATNPEEVSYDFLENEMLTRMQGELLEGFVYLMGFAQQDKIVEKFHAELVSLVEEFSFHARSCYFRKADLCCNSAISLLLHLYDFSLFFRFFPLLKKVKNLSPEDCLKRMLGGNIANEDFALFSKQSLNTDDEYLITNVLSQFKKYFVTNSEEVHISSEVILAFIKKYNFLFDKIVDFFKMDLDEVMARAYILNEDRYYMFPACNLSFYLSFNHDKQSEKFTSKLIDLTIKACQRNPDFMQEYIANLRIYKEGYTYFLLDGKGRYQIVIVLFEDEKQNLNRDQVEMIFDDKSYIITKMDSHTDVKYCTQKMSMHTLLDGFSRNYSINYSKIKIQSEQKEFSLTPLVKISF